MKKKQIIITLSAMALTAALTIGGTLAYLSAVTETKENVFSSDDGLKGRIEEVWDKDQGSSYTPGEVITKRPWLVLTKGSSDSFAAATITCVDNEGNTISLEDFESKYGEIKYNNNGVASAGINPAWVKVGGTDNMYVLRENGALKKLVATTADATTTPMFDSVTVLTGIEEVWEEEYKSKTVYEEYYDEDGKVQERVVSANAISSTSTKKYIKNADGTKEDVTDKDLTKLPKFQINVKGYLVQAEGVDETTAITELKKLAKDFIVTK